MVSARNYFQFLDMFQSPFNASISFCKTLIDQLYVLIGVCHLVEEHVMAPFALLLSSNPYI